jgi:hypothetical protein
MSDIKQRQRIMYGCDLEEFVESVERSMTFQLPCGKAMVIMSILSDAQEEIAMGLTEQGRQTINRAKYLVRRYLGPETGQ